MFASVSPGYFDDITKVLISPGNLSIQNLNQIIVESIVRQNIQKVTSVIIFFIIVCYYDPFSKRIFLPKMGLKLTCFLWFAVFSSVDNSFPLNFVSIDGTNTHFLN